LKEIKYSLDLTFLLCIIYQKYTIIAIKMLSLNDPFLISFFNASLFLIFATFLFFYKFIYPKKNINLVLILLIVSTIPILSIFRMGTFEAGDLRPHTAQLIDFFYNLREGIIVPRWSSNLCAGYGCPIYIIEYTLPYYFGSVFMFLGFSALNSIKLVLALSFIASGLTMYLWAKDEFGRIAGFFASLVYLFTPYHLIDLHFRASVGEVLSFVFMPLLFFFSKKLILKSNLKFLLLLSLTIWALILTHSSTTLVVLPISFGYAFLIWYSNKKRYFKDLIPYFLSLLTGLLISSYYWLPALVEVKYTWWSYFSSVEFRPITDYLFSTSYFGFLYQLNDGRYTPIIGYFQIFFVILGLITILFKKIKGKNFILLSYFLLTSLTLFILMLSITKPLWENAPVLKSFLFSYRLLVPLAFVNSAIGGILITKIKNIKIIGLLCFLVISISILNWANRKMVPELKNPFQSSDAVYSEYFDKTKAVYISRHQSRAGRQEEIFNFPRSESIEIIKGNGKIVNYKRGQEFRNYLIKTSEKSILKENTFYFPGWKVYSNGKEVPINYEASGEENFGKIIFSLEKGEHMIDILYEKTSIERFGRNLSFLTISAIFLITVLNLMKKNRTIDKFKK